MNVAPPVGVMPRPHVFDSHFDVANRWLNEVALSLDLTPAEHPRAMRALRAGLHAIRDRLPANEAVDLGAQLPTLIRGLFYEGWTFATDPTRIRDREAMLARVQEELASDPRLAPIDVLRAVIHVLVEHVSPGEIRDVVATLPKPIAALWLELTGHAIEPLPIDGDGLTRHTGYTR